MPFPRALARLALVALCAACGNVVTVIGGGGEGSADEPASGAGGASTVTASSSAGGAASSTSTVTTVSATGGTGGSACMEQVLPSTSVRRPVDAIFLVDNFFNQNDLQAGVEANISPNFAQILEALGVDLQVIVLSDHGANAFQVCIPPPLSGTTQCAGPAVEVPGVFRHYDVSIPPNQGVCRMLDTLYGANSGGLPDDGFNNIPGDNDAIHPDGWEPFLRLDAYKAFIVATGTRMSCAWSTPGQFLPPFCDPTPDNPDPVAQKSCYADADSVDPSATTSPGAWAARNLRDRMVMVAPGQFGASGDGQSFDWFSLLNVTSKADPAEPYGPGEPLVTTSCTAGNLGIGHQWLSRGTDGTRYSSCTPSTFDVIFTNLAVDIEERAKDPCAVELDAAPPSDLLALESGTGDRYTRVASPLACQSDDEFYLDGAVASLCPSACVQLNAGPPTELTAIQTCPPLP